VIARRGPPANLIPVLVRGLSNARQLSEMQAQFAKLLVSTGKTDEARKFLAVAERTTRALVLDVAEVEKYLAESGGKA